MENLIFSLNATLPLFLLMALGYIFNRINLMDERAANWMNKFVFKVALPVVVFEDLATQDFRQNFNLKFILYCFITTVVSIALISLLGRLLVKTTSRRGEFVQGAYRSSAALLGMAFIHNIYGDGSTGMAPLMILGSVPLYNIFAVIILTLTVPRIETEKDEPKEKLVKKTVIGIVTNPIILGILLGLVWSLIRIPMPKIMGTVVDNVGCLATPLGLMSMGATFKFKEAIKDIKPAVVASFIKLFGLVALFIPVAVYLGFAGEQIVAILVMLGSATTVSSFIMAKSMGHEGTLSSSIVMMTTFLCSFSLTFWLYLFKTLGLI
ncbi:AEC family transporter [Butyrivibrio proteoclasticus]|uniref:AEC family transporter n=1 Tax=Butyrivibrio proteoclasticus TaxID=43305 RepID=UPI00047A4980|nr:AEC family transporter [Butyrivibrio proteoclasticus]